MLAGEGATGLPRHDNKTIRIYLYEVKRSAECRGLRRRKKKQKKKSKKNIYIDGRQDAAVVTNRSGLVALKCHLTHGKGKKMKKEWKIEEKNEKKNKLKEIF